MVSTHNMSRAPWNETPIQKEARRWKTESAEEANARTLARIKNAQLHRNLLRDITKLAIIESRYSEETTKVETNDVHKIPCPICKSVKYLVEAGHSKILICERPNCIYERAIQRRDREAGTIPALKIVK